MTTTPKRQIHLAAHFPGVNNTTVWTDPRHESQIEFDAFERFAATAERGLFDYIFLAEGLRLREHKGEIYDLDVVGRPATLPILTAMAAVTSHVGFVGTLSATFNEPYTLARQLSTLDHLSNGRAGWNVVTSPDAFTGENFRRGGYLNPANRYERAREFVRTAKELWSSWNDGDVVADASTGEFLRRSDAGAFAHEGDEFSIRGRFNVPASPQLYPVIVQAGDSGQGRDFAASEAEVIFSIHIEREAGIAFANDIDARLKAHGREPGSIRILPATTFALGETADEALEVARETARNQVSGQTAIATIERVWGRDLSAYDPDGPLPEIGPVEDDGAVSQGRARMITDPRETIARWRERAERERLSIRELIIAETALPPFIGTPAEVARQLDEHVQSGASHGFTLVGTHSPGGLEEFTDRVIPHLQERGVYRTEYPAGATLRDLLDLPPVQRRPADTTTSTSTLETSAR